MKHLTLLLMMAGLLLFASCTTTKMLTSNVKPIEVTDVQHFEPFSYITLIRDGNKGVLHDSLSLVTKQYLKTMTSKFRDQIHITDSISTTDTLLRRKMERETEYLILSASQRGGIKDIKITPTLDSLLEAKGKRFGLITVSTGFTRTKKNYADQNLKGVGMAFVTLGMFYQVPIKASSTVYAMIVDAKENNIAFFRRSYLQNKVPLNKTVVGGQLQSLFSGYFYQ